MQRTDYRRHTLVSARRLLLLFVVVLLFGLFGLGAFLGRLLPGLAALAAILGAPDQLGTDHLDDALLGAVALPGSQTGEARVAALALREARSEGFEEFLDRLGPWESC